MDLIFFDKSDKLLFVRNDAEEAHWVQHEMQLTATFPLNTDKYIIQGMRVCITDPATGDLAAFEIRNVQTIQPEAYQQIVAESVAISELSDEHIDNIQITDKTPQQALATALTGVNYWGIGNVSASNVSSCDISRGSVWQAIKEIEQNWNVYCIPRVTITASGIASRLIDIIPAGGTFRGLRLSIRKNMSDQTVTFDDTDVLTAMYGYGGQIEVPQAQKDDKKVELTFADQVWSQTAEHPAKPAGQKYLEWPEKTSLYGRNGRPRFGYYQNADIKDGAVLLQKTWEALKQTCDPKIEIRGTCTDLYRLGYKDQPLRLHDTAIIEVEDTSESYQKEIIALDIDLLDPTGTQVEIGDYISNIIYISRETNKKSTGKGGGGGRGQTKIELDTAKTYAEFEKTNDKIGMVVGTINGTYKIKAGEIALSINETTGESRALIDADHINISGTQDVYTLAGDIVHDVNTGRLVIKNAGGLYVQRTEEGITAQFGIWDSGNLTGGIMATAINGQTTVKIKSDVLEITGATIAGLLSATDLSVGNITCGDITFNGDLKGAGADFGSTGQVGCGSIDMGGSIMDRCELKIDNVRQAYFIGTKDVNFDRAAAYKQGWNDCVDACTPHTYLRSYNKYNNWNSTVLWTAPSSSADKAADGAQKWTYGGNEATAYTIPQKK